MSYHFEQGEVLLIDKPLGWTSFDVVGKIRALLKYKVGLKKLKVGHAGTLDPLASGLLILCTGKYTKRIDEFQAQVKEYTGTFTIGSTTPSYDLETEINSNSDYSYVTEELIQNTTHKFIGTIHQLPPIYSAIKIEGKRAYEFARQQQDVELKTREITIDEFEITNINLPEVEFRVVCSKGTYIRSLANDFGKALGCGAHLSALRRTRIGKFSVSQAKDPETLKNEILKTLEILDSEK
jgi:tRNA pseudouridine55 synthase